MLYLTLQESGFLLHSLALQEPAPKHDGNILHPEKDDSAKLKQQLHFRRKFPLRHFLSLALTYTHHYKGGVCGQC